MPQSSAIEKLCKAYGLMLRAYQRAFRERFGREMQLAFRSEAYRTSMNQGHWGLFFLLLRTASDWVVTLFKEHCDMLIHFAVTALRNIARHKLYSFINIVGLAIGLTCAIFIVLFVRDETLFDSWLPQTANLYRLENRVNVPGRSPLDLAGSPFPVPAAMKDHIPEVQAITRIAPESITLTVGDRQLFDAIQVVDPNFLPLKPKDVWAIRIRLELNGNCRDRALFDSSFAYHVELHWSVFAAASLGALLIALLTVAGQAWIAARQKPVLALRYE